MNSKPVRAWVVDDDPLQVLILNRLLSANQLIRDKQYFGGSKAASEALASCKKDELPDIIFLDLIMSKGDGWDFLDNYKKFQTKFSVTAKIVVISSFNEENMIRLKQYPYVVHFLSKPIEVKDLEMMVGKLINGI